MTHEEELARRLIVEKPWAVAELFTKVEAEREKNGSPPLCCIECGVSLSETRVWFCTGNCSKVFMEKHAGNLLEIITQ